MYAIHSIYPISLDSLTALDLAHAIVPDARAYVAVVACGDDLKADTVQALLVPGVARVGIAWGGPAVWGDIREGETVQQLVEEYLSGDERFARRA